MGSGSLDERRRAVVPKWADDVSWWIANAVVAALLALTLFAIYTVLGLTFDRALAAFCVAVGWLIGRSGMRR